MDTTHSLPSGTIAAIKFLHEHDCIKNVRITPDGLLRVASSAMLCDGDNRYPCTVIETVEPKPKAIRDLLGY